MSCESPKSVSCGEYAAGYLDLVLHFHLNFLGVPQHRRYRTSDGLFRYHDFCSELDEAQRQRILKTETKAARHKRALPRAGTTALQGSSKGG